MVIKQVILNLYFYIMVKMKKKRKKKMLSIKDYLTNDHRKCDTLFARMEEQASESLPSAKEATQAFVDEMEHHFQMEERVMFVEFEAKTGMSQGPTSVMRQEHMQMRNVMNQLLEAVENEDKEKFFGLSETLMILLQQHNMKEEQMLYSMAQQHLSAESDRVVEMMEALIVE
jgi:hemerythrin-like domain-containing protein